MKLEKSHIRVLTEQLKALDQKEATSSRRSRWQEIINLRAEINKVQTMKQLQRVNETKSECFENINMIDKPLSKPTKKQRIQRIFRSYFENLFSTKLENLKEMDSFLDKYQLPRLNHDQINSLNWPITPNEIEAVIESLPTKKSPRPDGFTTEFYQKWKQELIPLLLKLFCTIEADGLLQNSFYESTITLITKSRKVMTKKENYSPLSIMNIDAKIFNKILANRMQEHIRKIIHHDQVGFIPGMQVWFKIRKSINVIHHVNKLKKKNHMIISLDSEKAFDKIQHPFIIKNLERIVKTGTYLNMINAIHIKPIANIKLNGEKLKAFPLKWGTRQGCPLSPYLFNIVLEVVARAIRQKRGSKGYKLERKKSNFHHLQTTW